MKKRHSISKNHLYDYSSPLCREETAAFLLDFAARHRQKTSEYWDRMRRYYDGSHDIRSSSELFAKDASLPWLPAQSTDGYVHVETQINPSIPDFEFSPRDASDADKAKQRERIVKYVCDNNSLDYKNSRNERRLNICGSAVWKVCWDSNAPFGEGGGDVTVTTPDVYEIFPDPTAADIDSCEYVGYVYRMHRQRAARVFASDFEEKGESIADYLDTGSFFGSLSSVTSDEYDTIDDTVTVTEWWFRQPADGEAKITRKHNGSVRTYNYKWIAGDIALSVLINGREVRYIPKYWRSTDSTLYPFVLYSKIPNDRSIWGKSELEQIIPLIDAKDRELTFAQLNSAFASNDIILAEENAFCDGETIDNSPGTVWKLRPGMMGKVARLGNMASAQTSLYANGSFWQSLIETTTGNFEVNQGKEPSNVTTATGIALLNERAESRKNLKNADRNAGFKRLFMLIDMTALEYYNDGRIIRMGAAEGDEFVFRFGGFVKKTRERAYIPALDVTIHTGSPITNSKAFTVSALTSLISMNINSDNYKLVKAYVNAIALPDRAKICEFLEQRFGNGEGAEELTDREIINIIESIPPGEADE